MAAKPISPKSIVVVGGSLGGLMAAISLLSLGHRVTILERSPTPLLHDQGAGIVAGGETLEFWSRFQPGAASQKSNAWKERDIAVNSRQRLYLDIDGQVIDQEAWTQRMTSWDLLYHLGRAAFDGVESEYLIKREDRRQENGESIPGSYRYGASVKNVRDMGDSIEIDFDKVTEGAERSTERMQADFLIAADGPSSLFRGMLVPDAGKRVYVGYVAFRGTVPEVQLSETARDVFVESFTFFHGPGCQILAYTIPGLHGTLEKGKRLVNWVWYWNFPEDSAEFKEVMTDRDGKHHRFTLPAGGKMAPQVWSAQIRHAEESLPPQFLELVEKTTNPFVQAITDLPPPPEGTQVGRLVGGKAILVGDALCGFRPHTAASTSQAALHALLLEKVFAGEINWEGYEERVMAHARFWQDRGVMLGRRSQFGTHPMSQPAGGNPVSWEELNMRKKVLEGAPDRK